jgi:hypothetical protein
MYSRQWAESASKRSAPLTSAFGFALSGPTGEIYDEDAFRHFLDVERTRAKRSDRSMVLLLVSLRPTHASGAQIPLAISSRLFEGLSHCVREVDFIGWYREQRVAGAVLAQGCEKPGVEATRRITERVTTILRRRLPPAVAERLRIRVIQLGTRAK